MYTYSYKYSEESGSSLRPSILEVKFDFSGESISREKQSEVEFRYTYHLPNKDKSSSTRKYPSDIKEYLSELGYYEDERFFNVVTYVGKKEVLKIKPFLLGLGFHLRSEAQGLLLRKDMINLQSLDEFILNGIFDLT
ncbi:MAG: hypothetical protein WC867_08040 [Candidatus Pacearchaeota archaeon]|jgi:hypothetical protein